MSAHLVETSEEDSYLAVAQHIATLLNNGQVSDHVLLGRCSMPDLITASLLLHHG